MATEKKEKDKIIEVADYFIRKSQEDPEKGLDALKLQKLLYYTKAWHLVFRNGKKIFSDDFQAWVHGPANPKVWHYFKDFDFSKSHPEFLEIKFDDIGPDEKEIMDMVWSIYGKYDGKYLEALTHNETPWIEARKGLGSKDISQNIISDEAMKSYYERILKEATSSHQDNKK